MRCASCGGSYAEPGGSAFCVYCGAELEGPVRVEAARVETGVPVARRAGTAGPSGAAGPLRPAGRGRRGAGWAGVIGLLTPLVLMVCTRLLARPRGFYGTGRPGTHVTVLLLFAAAAGIGFSVESIRGHAVTNSWFDWLCGLVGLVLNSFIFIGGLLTFLAMYGF